VSSTILLGVIAFVLFAALAAWSSIRLRQEVLPWILLGLSTLGSAGLIALGRTGAGSQQALASHYVTATYSLVLACVVTACLLLTSAKRGQLVPLRHGLVLILVAAPVLHAAAIGFRILPVLRSWSAINRANSLEIVRGTATDKAIQTSHHPTPELVRSGVTVLRDYHLSWYHDVVDGYPPSGTVDLVAERRPDKPPVTVAVNNEWQVAGWAVRSRRDGGPVKAIELFIDDRMIASARLDIPRPDVADHFGSSRFLDSGWMITIPPDAVAEGTHRMRIDAFGYGGCHVSLLETEMLALDTAAIGRIPAVAPRAVAVH
jgi:hypothetical protein